MHTYCFNQVTLRLRWFSEFLNCITKASCKSIWMVELYLLSWSGQPPIKPYEWNIVSRLLFHFVSTKNIHLTFNFSFFSPSSFVYISIADTVINFICFNWAIILVIHFFSLPDPINDEWVDVCVWARAFIIHLVERSQVL